MLEQANTLAEKVENFRSELEDFNGGIIAYDSLENDEDRDVIIRKLGSRFIDETLSKASDYLVLAAENKTLPPLDVVRKIYIRSLKLFPREEMPLSKVAVRKVLRAMIAGSAQPIGEKNTLEAVSQVNDFLVPVLRIYPELITDRDIKKEVDDILAAACINARLEQRRGKGRKLDFLVLKMVQLFGIGENQAGVLSLVEHAAESYLQDSTLLWDPRLFIWLEETFPLVNVDFQALRLECVTKALGKMNIAYTQQFQGVYVVRNTARTLPLIADTFEKGEVLLGHPEREEILKSFAHYLLLPAAVSEHRRQGFDSDIVRIIPYLELPRALDFELREKYGLAEFDFSDMRGPDVAETLTDFSTRLGEVDMGPALGTLSVWDNDFNTDPSFKLPNAMSLRDRVDTMTDHHAVFLDKTDKLRLGGKGMNAVAPVNEPVEEMMIDYEARRNRLAYYYYDEGHSLKESLALVLKWFYDEDYFEYIRNESSVVAAFSGRPHGNCDTRETAMGTLIMDTLWTSTQLKGLYVEKLKKHVRLIAHVNDEWLVLEGMSMTPYTPQEGTTLTRWESMYEAASKGKEVPVDFDYRVPKDTAAPKPRVTPADLLQSTARAVLDVLDAEQPKNSFAGKHLPAATAESMPPTTLLRIKAKTAIKRLVRPKVRHHQPRHGQPASDGVSRSAFMAAAAVFALGVVYTHATPTQASSKDSSNPSLYVGSPHEPMEVQYAQSAYELMLVENVMRYSVTDSVLNPPNEEGVVQLSDNVIVIKKSGWEALINGGNIELTMNGENLDLEATVRELQASDLIITKEVTISIDSGKLGMLKIQISKEGKMTIRGTVSTHSLLDRLAREEATYLSLKDQGFF